MTNPRKRKLETVQEQKVPKQAKVSADSKSASVSPPPAELKIGDILSVKSRIRHESKEKCTRKIYKSVRINGATYVSKIDFDSDGAVSSIMDNEIATLFLARILSPYHEKHPKAYHSRVKYPNTTRESFAVAVEEIPEFKTLNAFTPERMNELVRKGKLRGLGVVQALAKILNISDLPPRNVAIADAKNLERDDKESYATAVLHDGDSGFAKGVVLCNPSDSSILKSSNFRKTRQGFKLKTDTTDLEQWTSLDGEWDGGKYYVVPEEKKLICTDDIAWEHDITVYHLLILPPALLEKFLYHVCKHNDTETINDKYLQLLSSQEEFLDCVYGDDNFRKLVDDSFSDGTLEEFIKFIKTLGPELNAPPQIMREVEAAIRAEAVQLKERLSVSVADQLDPVGEGGSLVADADVGMSGNVFPPPLALDAAGTDAPDGSGLGGDSTLGDSSVGSPISISPIPLPQLHTFVDSSLNPLPVNASDAFAASAVALSSEPTALPMPQSPKLASLSMFRRPSLGDMTLPMDGLSRSLSLGNGNMNV